MTETPIEILLVEDNPSDVALALHAFKKYQLANHVHVIRDGVEALEFLFCTRISPRTQAIPVIIVPVVDAPERWVRQRSYSSQSIGPCSSRHSGASSRRTPSSRRRRSSDERVGAQRWMMDEAAFV